MSSSCPRETRPACSVRTARSTVTICETFATESFGRPVERRLRSTFPGAETHRRLLVKGTTTTVARRLAFRASPWTITTGRTNPGPEPIGSGNEAHKMSPCATTTRCVRARGGRLRSATYRARSRYPPKPRPSPVSQRLGPDEGGIPPGLLDKVGSETCRFFEPFPRLDQRADPGSTRPFSYPEYNRRAGARPRITSM